MDVIEFPRVAPSAVPTGLGFRAGAAFTDLTPPLDDQGFTHDNVVSIVRAHGVPRQRARVAPQIRDIADNLDSVAHDTPSGGLRAAAAE